MQHSNLGIHIALAKYPLGQEEDFIKAISGIYNNYREETSKYLKLNSNNINAKINEFNCLYKPKIYNIFSDFDVAFISLVDNYKFGQRVFETNNDTIKDVSYQIISGSLLGIIENNFLEHIQGAFVKIIQFKINNGVLIGLGNELFDECVSNIVNVLKKNSIIEYLIIDSYNWSEITVLAFHDDPNLLANFIMQIRLDNIGNTNINVDCKCLYNKWFGGVDNYSVKNSHLFSETFSYLGYDIELIKKELNDPKIKECKLKTSIEWQIKPGHLPYIIDELKRSNIFKVANKNYANIFFKNGKTDYVFLEKNSESFSSNIQLNKYGTNNKDLARNVRKLKTIPLYSLDKETSNLLEKRGKPFWGNAQNYRSSENKLIDYKISNISKVIQSIKTLNISRFYRKKIEKIIYNYPLRS